MKHRLLALLAIVFIPFISFAEDEFPSSATAYLDSSIVNLKEISGQYDVQGLKNDFALLVSQIEDGDHSNAKLSLGTLLRKDDFQYIDAYKRYAENKRSNIQDTVHGFVTSISYAASKSTFELASIVAGGVVHFYPDFVRGISVFRGEEDGYLFECLLKLALYNAIQNEKNFENVGMSLRKVLESRFSDSDYGILSGWSWLLDNNYMFGYPKGYLYLVDISRYEAPGFPQDYIDRYEGFRLWKWGRFDYAQRMKQLRDRYGYNREASASLDTMEALIAGNRFDELKEFESEFNERFYYSWSAATEDSILAEVVCNAEKIHLNGIPFDYRPVNAAPILGCEVNQAEVDKK